MQTYIPAPSTAYFLLTLAEKPCEFGYTVGFSLECRFV
jgi:hypothetical protein